MTASQSRRDFLKTSTVLATAMGATRVAAAPRPAAELQQEFYELRVYQALSPDKREKVEAYLAGALMPALGRMGIDRIGVFTTMDTPTDNSLYVLIPYASLDVLATVNPNLLADERYQDAAQAYFAVPKDDPLYSRIHSRLYKAFGGMPVMELPSQTKDQQPRIFELRIYQSHTEEKAALKVDMFNQGEIQVMRESALAPVFFGEALVGDDVPNLAYMLSAADRDAHKAHWSTFSNHPEWNRMKKLPKYLDTVSNISSTFLVPATCSQL